MSVLAAAGVVLLFALPGGAYDLVVRGELGIAAWWILGLGIATGVLPRGWPARPAILLVLLLSLYGALVALSLTWSDSAELTSGEVARVVQYVGALALLTAIVSRDSWKAVFMGLVIGALLVALLALTSRLLPGGLSHTLGAPLGSVRLSYPFGYWNALGAWGAMSLTLALAWTGHDPSRTRRAGVLALVPAVALATYLTYSRAAIGGTVIGVLVVALVSRQRMALAAQASLAGLGSAAVILVARSEPQIANGTGTHGAIDVLGALMLAGALAAFGAFLLSPRPNYPDRSPSRRWRFPAVLAAAVILAAAVLASSGALGRAWHQFTRPTISSTANPSARLVTLSGNRYYVWRSALEAFRAHPANGLGAGTFQFWWQRHRPNLEFVRNVHSIELENLAELGIPGLVLIGVVLGMAVALSVLVYRRCRRRLSTGLGAGAMGAFCVFATQASVDWLWQVPAVALLAFGLVVAAGGRLAGPRLRLSWGWRSVVALAALGAIAVQLPGVIATVDVRHSQSAERSGQPAAALAWADAAVGAEPWGSSPYEQRALVLESARQPGRAAVDMRRAVSREPANSADWLLLARIEVERGRLTAALRDLRQARRLNPQAVGLL